MAESLTAEQWLYSKLTNSAALTAVVSTRIYAYVAPQGATLPCVVYQQQAARDVQGVGPARIWANMVYLVKVIGQTRSFGDLETAANAIDTALQAASGSNTRGNVWACVRDSPFALVESTEAGEYRHLGGIYRIFAK